MNKISYCQFVAKNKGTRNEPDLASGGIHFKILTKQDEEKRIGRALKTNRTLIVFNAAERVRRVNKRGSNLSSFTRV